MLIVMKHDATDDQIEAVLRVIEELGFKGHPMPGATRTAIGITGNQGAVDPSHFENLVGVAEAIRVSKPYKLISLDLRPEKTIVRVGDATIGGDELAIIAGPCAIESRAQAFAIAEAVRRSGARFFRGGAYKPRTSPYAFQGLGEEGLKILADVREACVQIKEGVQETPPRTGRGVERTATSALCVQPLCSAADFSGNGRRRQGRRHPARDVRCQSVRLPGVQLQTPECDRIGARLSVAHHSIFAGTRPHRHL